MKIQEMKKEDFEMVKQVSLYEELPATVNSIVMIPIDRLHPYSGYGMIDFVLVDAHSEPICRVSRGSDVVHIDGIGGHGNSFDFSNRLIECKAWKIDCLPCGYFRIFTGKELKVGHGISDIEIFSKK